MSGNAVKEAVLSEVADEVAVLFRRNLKGTINSIFNIVAAATSIFVLYTGMYGEFPPLMQRPLIVGACTFLIFLLYPLHRNYQKEIWIYVDMVLGVVALLPCIYLALYWQDINRAGFQATEFQLWLGSIEIILLAEATRRTTGLALPIISIIAILYALYGETLPVILAHADVGFEDLIQTTYLSLEGLWGIPTATMASYIYLFLLFGAFVQVTGTGDFFFDIAYSLFGKVRGGPAKISVVASGLFAMISGSSTANVAVDGVITINLMKKTGFPAHVAGAIEAVASTGGQFTPPVMCGTVFIMSEIIGKSYWEICIAAAIPALLYYVCCFVSVDMEAAKRGMKGLPSSELPKFKDVMIKNFHLLLAPIALIYFLGVAMVSPQKAAIWATIAAVVASCLRKKTRITPQKFYTALIDGAKASLGIMAVCACSGILINVLMITGLGMAASSILIELSGGHIFVLLILTMITSLIMGMGLPTMACYILLAISIAPALVQMGISDLAAHLFVFYYGCLCVITPPVALAVYVASAIANANFIKTGLAAVRIAAAGFIIPFFFVYSPALLAQGDIIEIITAVITAIVGVSAIAVGLSGYFLKKLKFYEILLVLSGGLMLVDPGFLTDIIGSIIICVFIVSHYKSWKHSTMLNLNVATK